MKTCVIYARYSSNNQTEQSIEGQIRVCREYAQRNNLAVAGTYIDRATTGTNDNREQFQKMLKDSDKKAWDYVLCYKLDRFSRNKYEMAIHRKYLKDNGVIILSAMENIPDSPEGILLESLLEGMNQYYSEELSQKTKRGLRETRIKGNYMGGPINYGYSIKHENIGDQIAAKVVINETEASILLHIFEAYAAGNRIPDIVRELDDKGVKNRGNPFTVNSIYFMLQQEKYTGVYSFNGETFTHIYPAIIPKELFQIVRKRIDKNKTGKHVVGVDYILMGKCYCGYCGHKLRSAAGTTTDGTILRYYRCPYSKKDVNCHNKSVRKEVLEQIVIDALTNEITKPENIALITDNVFALYTAKFTDDSDLHRYEKELSATDKAIKNMLTAIEEQQQQINDSVADLQSDETRAKKTLQKFSVEIRTIKRRVESLNLPGIPKDYLDYFFWVSYEIGKLADAINQVKIDMEDITKQLLIVQDDLTTLQEKTDDLRDSAELTERLIQYANRLSIDHEEINDAIAQAQNEFNRYNYPGSLEILEKAVEKVEPGSYKQMEQRYYAELKRNS